jgi:hypothetical protein
MEALKTAQESNAVLNLRSRIAKLQAELLKEETKKSSRQHGDKRSRVLAPPTPSPSEHFLNSFKKTRGLSSHREEKICGSVAIHSESHKDTDQPPSGNSDASRNT